MTVVESVNLHAPWRIPNLEAGNRSKIAAFTPHFPVLDKNIDAKSNFAVNKTIELAHIFFVIEMIRSFFPEGERTMAKAAKKAVKKATAKRAPAKKATKAAKKPAKKAAKKKRAA